MVSCSFCGADLKAGTGLMYVKATGATMYFCSRTCEKHMIKFGRDPRKFKYSTKYVKGGLKSSMKK